MIHTVIWDWNGTLLDDLEVSFSAINRVLTSNGYPPIRDLTAYREVFCFPVIEYYRRVGFDFARTPFEMLAQQFMDCYHPVAARCALAPDALDTLRAVRELGVRQILLSASLQSHLEMQVARYPIRKYFDRLLGIGDIYAASKAKLAADFVGASGLPAEGFLFVGDTLHDLEVARGCGAQCLLYCGGHQSRGVLGQGGVPVIERLSQLPAFLRSAAGPDTQR